MTRQRERGEKGGYVSASLVGQDVLTDVEATSAK